MIQEEELAKSSSKISYYRSSNVKLSSNIYLAFNRLSEQYKTSNTLKFEKKINDLASVNHILENDSDKIIYVLQKTISNYKEEARKNAKKFEDIYDGGISNNG